MEPNLLKLDHPFSIIKVGTEEIIAGHSVFMTRKRKFGFFSEIESPWAPFSNFQSNLNLNQSINVNNTIPMEKISDYHSCNLGSGENHNIRKP